MRTAAKIDANQNEIVDCLRAIGCTVQTLASVGGGVPDLLVGFRGVNILLELKTERGRLRQSQWEWHREWRGQVATVRTFDEALAIIEGLTT